jgi:DNA-binding NtrC family response regulator
VSSTNKDLKKEVERGAFREDLFYRLNVVQINVPPLRERKEDIPLLATEFLNAFSLRENRPLSFTDEVMDIFYQYSWPGNVRQLKNVVERAVVLAENHRITVNELSEEFACHRQNPLPASAVKPLKMLEQQAITEALRVFNGNKSKAARYLGISRKTFYKRLSGM